MDMRIKCCDMHPDARGWDEIMATEWDEEFWERCSAGLTGKRYEKIAEFKAAAQNAMNVSHFKYGHVMASRGKIDFRATILARVELFDRGDRDKGIRPGNGDFLRDVYNFAMIERMHWRPESLGETRLLDKGDRASLVRGHVSGYSSASRRDLDRLVIIGAACVREYCDPRHPWFHFEGTDSSASPGVAVRDEDEDESTFVHTNSEFWI